MKKFCFVSGVHRSGTSTTAAMIAYRGYSVGKASVRHNGKDNSRGYYETLDIVRTNDLMAMQIGLRWDSLIASPAVFRSVHGEWYGRIKDAVRSNFDHVDRAVLKDPRFAAHLKPWWDAVFEVYPDARVSHVFVMRDPVAVAASLTKRTKKGGVAFAYGERPESGALFWIFQTIGFLEALVGQSVMLIDYAVQNSPDGRRALFNELCDHLGEAVDESAYGAFEREFFDAGERDGHDDDVAAAGEHPFTADARALYEMIRSGQRFEAILVGDLVDRYRVMQAAMGEAFDAECRPVLSRFAEFKQEYERGLAIARIGDFLFNHLTMDQLAAAYENRCRLTGQGLEAVTAQKAQKT